MRIIPTPSQKWSRFILFPFKAYSVLGIIVFFIWNQAYYHLHANPWWIYGNVAGIIWSGYLVSGLVLVIGGIIQMFVYKTVSSFFIGIVDLLVLALIAIFCPG
jgi:hypothetical protein